jgi:calcineurin-like phosphoesterase family protein
MHDRLIAGFNERLKPEDACIHVGDLGMGNKHAIYYTLAKFNGRWSLIQGNHDRNNGVKTIGKWLFTDIGRYTAFVCHVPYHYRRAEGSVKEVLSDALRELVEETCHFSICGHVHQAWPYSLEGKIPAINVGVDVRGYRPMFDDEIITEYERIMKR